MSSFTCSLYLIYFEESVFIILLLTHWSFHSLLFNSKPVFTTTRQKKCKPGRWDVRENKVVWGNTSLHLECGRKSGHSPNSPNTEKEHIFVAYGPGIMSETMHTSLWLHIPSSSSSPSPLWPRIHNLLPLNQNLTPLQKILLLLLKKVFYQWKTMTSTIDTRMTNLPFWKLLLPDIPFFMK